MILVVFGHVIGGVIASGALPGGSSQRVYDWVYSFHMPAFMLLSALFLERAAAKRGVGPFTIERLKRLYYPAVLWGLITWCLALSFSNYTNKRPDPWEPLRLLVDPTGSFWFLRTLLILSVVYALLRAARVPGWVMLAACAGGAAACIRQGWSLDSRALTLTWYGAWLALGTVVGPMVLAAGERARMWMLLAAAVGGAAGVTVLLPPATMGEVFPSPLCAPFGVALLLAAAMALARSRVAPVLALVGRRSLEVFMVSGLASVAMRLGLTKMLSVTEPWMLLTACTAAGVVVPVVMAAVCERMGIGYVFQFGPVGGKREGVTPPA